MIVNQGQISSDISNAFEGDQYQKEKQILAQHVMAIAMDWTAQQPKGFNDGSLSNGEIRKKKRDNKKALNRHIIQQLAKDKQAAIDNHSVGFLGIGILIFDAIIVAVVEWVVTRILEHYFD